MNMRKPEPIEYRSRMMLDNIKSIALATNDLRWAIFKEGTLEDYDLMVMICDHLETCVKQATQITNSLEQHKKPQKSLVKLFAKM
jgi:hypothetical protein